MASIIKIKRKSNAAGAPGSLQEGELAVNLFSRKLYVGNSSGVTAISGESYSLTSQASSDGAYLKVNGETSSNSVLLASGTNVTVTRQANGSITVDTAATIDSDTTGNAATATALETARTIGGVSFDGTANINLPGVNTTGNQDTSGNAGTATALATGRTIAITGDLSYTSGSFDGTGNVTGAATLATGSGTTLANYMQVANTVLLVNDRMQVANVNSLISAVNTNLGQKLGATASVTLTGDVTGTASFSGNSVSIATTYNNDVVLGTDTSGNYVAGISGTSNEITVSGSGSEGATVTIGLPDDVTVTGQLNVGENVVVTGNTQIGGNLTVDGNLTVEGGITYLSTSTVYTDDGMMKLSANNTADATDTGIYSKYIDGATTKYAGYFRDASDEVFKFYKELQSEPTTTVDTGGTGYALAQVDAVIDGGTY